MFKALLTLLVFSFGFLTFAQGPNQWDKRLAFGGLKRERAVGFSVGNYGYIATGEDTANVTHNDLWQYDPTLDIWTQKADLPASPRRNAIAFSLGNRGYVGTGIDSSESFVGTILKDFWEYNPDLNSWVQKADYPGAGGNGVYYAAAFTADEKGYITCGKIGPNNYAFDLWEYKPTTNSWSQRANFPGGVRYALTALSIDNIGYVGMGIDNDMYRKDWWQYNPGTNLWTVKANLPGSERGAASSFTLGSRGFVVFGSDGGYKDELWMYNPYNNSWNIKSNYSGGERRNGVAFAIADTGYAGTGKGPTGLKQNFYAYTPALPLAIEKNEFLSLQIYPNPIVDQAQLYIQNTSNAAYFIIVNNNGQLVARESIVGQTVNINRGELSSGIYHLIVVDQNNQPLATEKIIFI